MQLIDKQQDVFILGDFTDYILDALFKFAPVLGARHHAGKIQHHDPFVLDCIRHKAPDDPLGQTLGDGRLAHTGFPDQAGIVLRPPAQDLYDAVDLHIPADDRIQLPFRRQSRQIAAVLIQRPRTAGMVPGHLHGPAAVQLFFCKAPGRATGYEHRCIQFLDIHLQCIQ